jgi:hypothetical protein
MATATGVVNASLYIGDAITTNSGSITAVAIGGLAPYGEFEAVATGVYNFAVYYDSIVDNSGSIEATASATADISGTDWLPGGQGDWRASQGHLVRVRRSGRCQFRKHRRIGGDQPGIRRALGRGRPVGSVRHCDDR